MSAEADIAHMGEALALGRTGQGASSPNPSVGAVLVREGALVGAGVTQPDGRPHGERVALDAAGPAARGATLYVTLEPCAHAGRGPCCADGLIAAGVARIVSAMEDPDPRTAGEGHSKLRAAGIAVDVGLGGEQARRDHRGHILRVLQNRPMVTLKFAQTADGYAAGMEDDPRLAITGEAANVMVHALRARHDSIMVGAGTAQVDDPMLTVRLPGSGRKPLRVVLDSSLSLNRRSRLAATARDYPTLLLATARAGASDVEAMGALGVDVETVGADRDGHVDLLEALRALARRGSARVFSEGGPLVGGRLIAQGLADEVYLFTSFKPLGRPGLPALSNASQAILADSSRYRIIERGEVGRDRFERHERVGD